MKTPPVPQDPGADTKLTAPAPTTNTTGPHQNSGLAEEADNKLPGVAVNASDEDAADSSKV